MDRSLYIGNWDGRGHILSLDLKYYPGGGDRKFTAMPLFNTVNYLEQAGQPYPIFMLNDSLQTEFTLDHPVENAMLCYTTTEATAAGEAATSSTRRPTPSYSTDAK